MRGPVGLLMAAAFVALPASASAKDALGVFADWGAFRDTATAAPRCYAIAKAAPSRLRRDFDPYASIGTWPKAQIRGQVFFRMSRRIDGNRPVILTIGDRSFAMVGNDRGVWARGRAMDAAIVSAMRSARGMTIRATGRNGRPFSNSYALEGAATAMDAATVGCSRLR